VSSFVPLSRVTGLDRVGNKATNLDWLQRHDAAVPATWVLPAGSPVAESDLHFIEEGVGYAVRSSASVEDSVDLSFAGQFTTKLDVVGIDSVLAAVEAVRASIGSELVRTYAGRAGVDPDTIDMGVIVQEMVTPIASGVAFSRNPITGLNEAVVEAVAGRGDRLVDDGVTPDRWIHRWGELTTRPVAPVVGDEVIQTIVGETARLAESYRRPIDIEWVWDGRRVWVVQLRPVTGIANIAIYSNRISSEVMPGIIKPLVWSVNVPVVNRAWIDLITEAIGPNDLQPDDLARSFGYRAYFNMGAFGDIFEAFGMPRDSLELLLGLPEGEDQPGFKPTSTTFRKTPRLLAMAVRKLRMPGRTEAELARLESAYAPFVGSDLARLSTERLLSEIDDLKEITTRAAAFNIVIPLLANLSNSLFRRTVGGAGLDPEQVAVSTVTEMEEVNPQAALDALAARAALLEPATRNRVASEGLAALPSDLADDVRAFLVRFGHFSVSGNDFSVPPWRETPDAVARLIVTAASGPGVAQGATGQLSWAQARQSIPPRSRATASFLHRRTARLIGLRERVSSAYTRGYGLFRPYFLELGRRLVDAGELLVPDDAMYLSEGELRSAMNGALSGVAELVGVRKSEIATAESFVMPEIIVGDDFVPTTVEIGDGHVLSGVPTARGRYRGTVRVVRGFGDFDSVQQGDIISVPFSDVGWTPLFARAGAVVAEAGGLLSHSSIVAREYGIPCVVSVTGALQIPDGATAIVDGYAGTVTIEAA
jgi:pyruvate,water dikinase